MNYQLSITQPYRITTGGNDAGDQTENRVKRPEKQFVVIRHDLTSIKASCATKDDLIQLYKAIGDLKSETTETIGSLRPEIKEGISKLSTDIHKTMNTQLRWIIGTYITTTAALAGGLYAIFTLFPNA